MTTDLNFYTTRQVAQILHKDVVTIRRYIHQNKFLGTVFFGKEYLIPESSLVKFLHNSSPDKFAERSA